MLFCRNLFISGGLVFLLVLGLVALTTGFCADLSLEQQEIRKAATRYLEAEVQRDLKTVYKCLAPSSDYLAAHNFEAFLEEAETSPVRIVSYQILNISLIGENPDKAKYPRVTRTAQVEVDVIILYTDTKQRSVVNYAFPFVQEGGEWYKL